MRASDAMLAAVVGAASDPTGATAAIGLLSADITDTNRTKVHELAFQDVGQTCGYYPDSTDNAVDKQNVRDGHYSLWGPLHFFTKAPSQNAQQVEGAR